MILQGRAQNCSLLPILISVVFIKNDVEEAGDLGVNICIRVINIKGLNGWWYKLASMPVMGTLNWLCMHVWQINPRRGKLRKTEWNTVCPWI